MDRFLPPGVHSFRPVDDPLANWPKDRPLPVRLVEPGCAPASAVAEKVANWDYYDGAIVMVGVTDGETYLIEGSGVMVAPGLVLSATHVLRHHADAIAARTLSVYCVGVRSGGRADLWAVHQSLRYAEDHSDIMFLGVELNSEISDDWYAPCLPISTRAPEKGESLTIVGYRFDRDEAEPLPIINGVRAVGRGDLYIAAGEVETIYYPHRDRLLAPFPAIEIKCGSLGSMSGGAVIDQGGALVGILSRGWGDDGPPSTAAWIIHAFMFDVTLPWPPGAYDPNTPILDLPNNQLKIYGRDKVRLVGPLEIEYTAW
jgi:Trypsin-like peptidase domain